VQLAQLRLRLDAFAEKQAQWRERGWKIIRTELEEDHGELIVDDVAIQLRGRIDRIDHRVKNGIHQFAVLDYKTGDAGDAPKKKHLKGHRTGEPVLPGHWVDLQLPLYRYLLKSIDELGMDVPESEQSEVKLGYVLLPSVASETRFEIATWSDETLASADQAAHEVVRRIRREEFWPPTDPYPYANTDDYRAIVQHGVFGRETLETEVADA
jgi:ATP-dependent helicase/nuclease subunit B